MDKQTLRKQYKKIRADIENRPEWNRVIFQKLMELPEYQQAKLILTYVSFRDEVDTMELIKYSLEVGKRVAVPRCEGKNITFYAIQSMDDLEIGSYGIPEPKQDEMIDDFSNSICLVPGIAFDRKKNRIGYGAGFYDRFLEHYPGMKIGLTYKECVCEIIDCDEYDIKMDIVVYT